MFPLGGGGLRISHGNYSHLLLRLRMHLAFHSPICRQDVKETVQLNFFNPTSDNLEILIIQRLRRVVPRAEVLFFTRKELHQWKRLQGYVQKGRSASVYQPLWIPLVSYCNFFSYEFPTEHTGEPWRPWTNKWRGDPNETPLLSCTAQL